MVTQNTLTWAMTGPDPTEGSNHAVVTVSTNDPRWSPLYLIFEAQKDVVAENSAAHDRYMEQLQSAQLSLNAHPEMAVAAPTKPLMKVVDDFGNVTSTAFVPPLPDLVPPAPPTPSAPLGGDPATRPADPNVVLAAQTKMLAQIAANVAKLMAKFGVQ